MVALVRRSTSFLIHLERHGGQVCASGLKAVMLAAQQIQLGKRELVVAGGMESMSNVPYLSRHMRRGVKMGDVNFEDAIMRDG